MLSNKKQKNLKQENKIKEILEKTAPTNIAKALADVYPNIEDMPKVAYPLLNSEQVNGWFQELESRFDLKVQQEINEFKKVMDEDFETGELLEKYKNELDLILACIHSLEGKKEISISSLCFENDDEPYLDEYETLETGDFKWQGEEEKLRYFLAKGLAFGGHVIVGKVLNETITFKDPELNEDVEFPKKKVYGLFMGGKGSVAHMNEDVYREVFGNIINEMFDDKNDVEKALNNNLYIFGDWQEIPAMKQNTANNLDMTNANKHKEKIDEILFQMYTMSGKKLVTIMYRIDHERFRVQNFDLSAKGDFLPDAEPVFRYFFGEALETTGSIIVRQFIEATYPFKQEDGLIVELPKKVLYGLAIQAGKTQALNQDRMKESHLVDADNPENVVLKEDGILYGDWTAVQKLLNIHLPKHKLH